MVAWIIPAIGAIGRIGLWVAGAGLADKVTGGHFFDSMKHTYNAVTGGNPANMADQRAGNMIQLVQNLEGQGKSVHIDPNTMSVSAIDPNGNIDFYVFTTKAGIHKVNGTGKLDANGVPSFTPTMPDYDFRWTSPFETGAQNIMFNTATNVGDPIKATDQVHATLVDVRGNPIVDSDGDKHARLALSANDIGSTFNTHFADKTRYQSEMISGLTGDLNSLAVSRSTKTITNTAAVDAQLAAFENITQLKFNSSLTREQKLAGMASFVHEIGLQQAQYDKLGIGFKEVIKEHYPDVKFQDISKNLLLPGLSPEEQRTLAAKAGVKTAAATPAAPTNTSGAAPTNTTNPGTVPATNATTNNNQQSQPDSSFLERLEHMSPFKKLIVGAVMMFVGPMIGGLAGFIPGIGGAAKGLLGFAGKGGGMAMLLQGGGELFGMNPIGWLKGQAGDLFGELKGNSAPAPANNTTSAPQQSVPVMPAPAPIQPLASNSQSTDVKPLAANLDTSALQGVSTASTSSSLRPPLQNRVPMKTPENQIV